MKTQKFQAELLGGHKGKAVLVPFDPEEAWGIKPQPVLSATYGKRPGHLVRGTMNGTPFEGWIGHRWDSFFILVDDELQQRAGLRRGDIVDVAVRPRTAPRTARKR